MTFSLRFLTFFTLLLVSPLSVHAQDNQTRSTCATSYGKTSLAQVGTTTTTSTRRVYTVKETTTITPQVTLKPSKTITSIIRTTNTATAYTTTTAVTVNPAQTDTTSSTTVVVIGTTVTSTGSVTTYDRQTSTVNQAYTVVVTGMREPPNKRLFRRAATPTYPTSVYCTEFIAYTTTTTIYKTAKTTQTVTPTPTYIVTAVSSYTTTVTSTTTSTSNPSHQTTTIIISTTSSSSSTVYATTTITSVTTDATTTVGSATTQTVQPSGDIVNGYFNTGDLSNWDTIRSGYNSSASVTGNPPGCGYQPDGGFFVFCDAAQLDADAGPDAILTTVAIEQYIQIGDNGENTYHVEFDMKIRYNNPDAYVEVLLDGNSVGQFFYDGGDDTSQIYSYGTNTFYATGLHRLDFRLVTPSGSESAQIDNIDLQVDDGV